MFFIKDLKLQNFRSHSFLDLQIVNDIVCIVGPNSIGKTSILEALSLITDKKGLKASDASDVIKKNSKEKTIISSIINLENKDFKIVRNTNEKYFLEYNNLFKMIQRLSKNEHKWYKLTIEQYNNGLPDFARRNNEYNEFSKENLNKAQDSSRNS